AFDSSSWYALRLKEDGAFAPFFNPRATSALFTDDRALFTLFDAAVFALRALASFSSAAWSCFTVCLCERTFDRFRSASRTADDVFDCVLSAVLSLSHASLRRVTSFV
ncbi:hypothetical protein ADL27_24390, partial [Streptomyces sp. NRRL F-6602]